MIEGIFDSKYGFLVKNISKYFISFMIQHFCFIAIIIVWILALLWRWSFFENRSVPFYLYLPQKINTLDSSTRYIVLRLLPTSFCFLFDLEGTIFVYPFSCQTKQHFRMGSSRECYWLMMLASFFLCKQTVHLPKGQAGDRSSLPGTSRIRFRDGWTLCRRSRQFWSTRKL